jgi:hypothetical protein
LESKNLESKTSFGQIFDSLIPLNLTGLRDLSGFKHFRSHPNMRINIYNSGYSLGDLKKLNVTLEMQQSQVIIYQILVW